MDPSEVEFMGEKELVTIIPNFNFGEIHLIAGSIGPFRAGLPTKVPLWLAVNLKQRQKCRLVNQDWMSVEPLTKLKKVEKAAKLFTEMPSDHYMDETRILLDDASEDITAADEIRTIVKDIWDLRMAKLRSSVYGFTTSDSTHGKIDHLTSMEINSIRPLLPHVLDQLLRIHNSGNGQSDSQDPRNSN